MRLISCYIENFGLIHTEEFNFAKGLNCCISENGTGKTTLTAFIEAMLYGIGDTRRQALDENPRKKYMPWQGGKFGGSLTIEAGKKKYVIERSFGAKAADDTFRLIDAESGRISNDYGEDIGERLFGIDRDGFLRTAFLSEKNLQGKNDNKSISAKLSDLVGVDGDVGGFDDAIKGLEERRRFYFKKGNTGEIANVKERINECQRRIDRISELEASAAEKEARIKEINSEKLHLAELEASEKAKLDALGKEKERSIHEERYSAMLESLKKEKERLSVCEGFFAEHLPTSVEIDGMRDAWAEAKRLKDEALSEKGNEEYVSLGEFFKCGTSFAEIAEAERYAALAEEKAKQIEAIDRKSDSRSLEMSSLFRNDAPTKEGLEAAKRSVGGRITLPKALLLIISVASIIAGLTLGGKMLVPLVIVGAALLIISSIWLVLGRKSKELLSFINKYGSDGDTVEKIEQRLNRYEQLKNERDEARASISEEHSEMRMRVYDFLGKFPITDASSMLGSVQIIRHKYTQYYALGQAAEVGASGKLEKLKRSEALSKKAQEFLSKFPVKTASPFDEIRDKAVEYGYLRASVARLERECDDYAVKHGVTGRAANPLAENEAAVKLKLSEIGEKMKILVAEDALVKKDLDTYRSEIDKIDEYVMEKDELEELCAKHVESLDVIKKTSQYLKEACDNITAKYLGKTKAKFEEYSRIISDVEGSFALNTSFELSRTERGESHGIEAYSRGTKDAYALGLRLALIDALYENEAPFIILDDPFIALDDQKLERAKAMLKALGKTRQILYFTCAKSRAIE